MVGFFSFFIFTTGMSNFSDDPPNYYEAMMNCGFTQTNDSESSRQPIQSIKLQEQTCITVQPRAIHLGEYETLPETAPSNIK